jgi:tRNA G46 methylase TrmB
VKALPDRTLNGVLCFYPDPWPKRSQRKKRIWKRDFFNDLVPKLRSQAFIFLKTDQLDYFVEMQNLFENDPDFFIFASGIYDQFWYDQEFSSFFENLFFKMGEKSFFVFAQFLK